MLGPEWFVILYMVALRVLFLLLVVFIVYRFWNYLKRRDARIREKKSRRAQDAAPEKRGGCSAGPQNSDAEFGGEQDVASSVNGEEGQSASPMTLQLLSRISSHGLDEVLAARGLSERESTVLQGICSGKTLAALAEELGVSRSTVGTYCTRAYEKLGVSSKEAARVGLVRLRREHLLVAAGLSDREAEVAVLAADNISTADIAAKLVISEATVNSHLQQAYTKLDVRSRAEVAELLCEIR